MYDLKIPGVHCVFDRHSTCYDEPIVNDWLSPTMILIDIFLKTKHAHFFKSTQACPYLMNI